MIVYILVFALKILVEYEEGQTYLIVNTNRFSFIPSSMGSLRYSYIYKVKF